MKDELFRYAKKGWMAIPVEPMGKRPLIKDWPTKASNDEGIIDQWFLEWPDANIGVVTGAISGIFVLDIDPRNNGQETLEKLEQQHGRLPETLTSNTGGGGQHRLFKYPEGIKIKSTKIPDGIDVQSDGKFIVLPPSIHSSGNKYEWVDDTTPIAEAPEWLVDLINKPKKVGVNPTDVQKISLGERDDTLASMAGKLHSQNLPKESISKILHHINETKCNPPLDAGQVDKIVDSITSYPRENIDTGRKPNFTDIILEDIKQLEGFVLYKDERGNAWVRYKDKESFADQPIKSGTFKAIVRQHSYKLLKRGISKDLLEQVVDSLEAQALCEGEEYTLKVRVAQINNDEFWYDLGNKAVKITSAGWEIVDYPPILFKRYSHSKNQVMPVKGGDLKKLLEFINVNSFKYEILLLTAIISGLIENIPHPIIAISGVQGSAKSTLLRLIQRILDPSIIEEISMTDIIELCQTADHRWVLPFDNLSFIKNVHSDFLCKVVTGAGFSKRRLFLDDDDIIRHFRRFIIINGVNQIVSRPDLLDRCIIIQLDRIEDDKRKTEAEINIAFNENLPFLLGACFDVLSKAIEVYPTLDIKNLPRLADFALWGCAISIAMGYRAEDFLTAYAENVAEQNDEAIISSPTAEAIIKYLNGDIKILEGTATEILGKLKKFYVMSGLEKEQLPKNAYSFGKKLREVKPNLQSLGYVIEESRGRERLLKIYPQVKKANVATVATVDASAGKGGNND